MPRNFDQDHPFADDLKRKDHLGVADLSFDNVIGGGLVEHCATRFSAARPYVAFLTRAVNPPF